MDLAASAGLLLDPWQQDVLRASLGERADGNWAAKRVGLIVGRQNGKGAVLEARELAGLFLFEERRIMHSAHLFKTSQDAFLRILTLIESTPDLAKRIKKPRRSHGQEGIETVDGRTLDFVARSTGGGRGLGGDLVVLDEAFELWDRELAAMVPTMSARENPQTWYTSSAPLDDARSDVLRRLCREGRKGAESLAYFEWSAGEFPSVEKAMEHFADPVAYEEGLASANPALGLRLSREFIEDVERPMLAADDFIRERFGIWVDRRENEGWDAIPKATWEAAAAPGSTMDGPFLAFDVSPKGTHAAIGAAGQRPDGTVLLEVVDSRAGTGWLVRQLVAVAAKQGATKVYCAGGSAPAMSLAPGLEKQGLEVEALPGTDMAAGCLMLSTGVKDGQVWHLGAEGEQGCLTEAVKGTVPRDMGDGEVWSRRKSSANITPLYAVTAALFAHRKATEDGPSVYESQELLVL